MIDIYARCEKECKSPRCDDLGADYCADWHTEKEHFVSPGRFCAKMAFLGSGCQVCQEYQVIWRELQDGETPERICHECYDLFKLDSENPYGEVLYHEGVGVYYECDKCFLLEGGGIDDLEDEIDRMAEITRKTHVTFDGQSYECVASDKENCNGDCTEPPPFRGFLP